MKLELYYSDYLQAMQQHVNEPLSLEAALLPFGLASLAPASRSLMVGHLLDYLDSRCSPHTAVDPIDIAQATWELGLDGSDEFLEEAPQIMIQAARALVG